MGYGAFLEIAAATVGTLSFAFIFNIRGKKLFFVTFGGMLGWSLFLLLGLLMENEVARYFIVSLLLSFYGELMARLLRTPTTTFSLLTMIPLVPGSGLYYTMTNAFAGNLSGFIQKGTVTLQLAAALSLGIVIVNTSVVYIKKQVGNMKN